VTSVLVVPSLLFDLLLSPTSTTSQHQQQLASSTAGTRAGSDSRTGYDRVLSSCTHLLRALSRDNRRIQRQVFDRFAALLDIDSAVHADIALLLRDVSSLVSNNLTTI